MFEYLEENIYYLNNWFSTENREHYTAGLYVYFHSGGCL